MKVLSRIILSIILTATGLAVIFFALPLILQSPDWIDVGGFIILAAIGVVVGVNGVRIAQGASVRDVLSDVFRGLGR